MLTRAEHPYESAQAYVDAGVEGRERDPVLTFQLRNDFQVIGLMPGYWPEDRQSRGYGIHLLWRNPSAPDEQEEARAKTYGGRLTDTVRVATVQYQQRRVGSFDEFLDMLRYFVDVTADYRADFCVFPELFSLQLLSMEDQELSPAEAIDALTRYTDPIKEALRDMAMRYNINIIAGSHPTKMANGRVENICYVCLRDGEVHEQAKIHPTPNEVYWWNIEGGHELAAINTDCGPIGALICYDTTPNVETVAFADLGLKALREARNTGTVQNLKDRRHDLYTTVWREH